MLFSPPIFATDFALCSFFPSEQPLLFSYSLLNFIKLRSILREDWSWTQRVNQRIVSKETPQRLCLERRVKPSLIVQRINPWKFR